jgi:hypothetical protein
MDVIVRRAPAPPMPAWSSRIVVAPAEPAYSLNGVIIAHQYFSRKVEPLMVPSAQDAYHALESGQFHFQPVEEDDHTRWERTAIAALAAIDARGRKEADAYRRTSADLRQALSEFRHRKLSSITQHGVGVTSAFLFGHIVPGMALDRPYAPVDHYRVLDTAPGQDPHELYEVLNRIDRVLVEKQYDFINLSIGPRPPVEDDDVHAWTAVIDDRLSLGTTLATIAVGNGGDSPGDDWLKRIQVPADCVNALAVGACDNHETPCARCSYSSVGPGRSPGLVKPDFVEFGGSLQRPFIVLSDGSGPGLEATEGTSFSAPSALRLGAGLRAHFGTDLSILAIRALLIHTTEPCEHRCEEVGRGRVARSLQDIVLCDDDSVRVVYQGEIAPARYVRAPIPIPSGTIPGRVRITATLCYPTGVDPHHPGNYTRAGLEPTFRPHDQKRKDPKQVHADSKGFFGRTQSGLIEDELRRDAWKWETGAPSDRSHRTGWKPKSLAQTDRRYLAYAEDRLRTAL